MAQFVLRNMLSGIHTQGENMRIIDGHSHMLQTFAPVDQLKRRVSEIKDFDMHHLLFRLDELGVSHVQTMAQDMRETT